MEVENLDESSFVCRSKSHFISNEVAKQVPIVFFC